MREILVGDEACADVEIEVIKEMEKEAGPRTKEMTPIKVCMMCVCVCMYVCIYEYLCLDGACVILM